MAKKSPEDQNEIPFLKKFMVSQTYDIFRFGGEEIKNDEVGIQRMLQNFSGLLTEEQIRENMKKYNLPSSSRIIFHSGSRRSFDCCNRSSYCWWCCNIGR